MRLVVRMMLAWNVRGGWDFLDPGPEIPDLMRGGHTHWPHWRSGEGKFRAYESQRARGIVFPKDG
jgi:hypothetical protein